MMFCVSVPVLSEKTCEMRPSSSVRNMQRTFIGVSVSSWYMLSDCCMNHAWMPLAMYIDGSSETDTNALSSTKYWKKVTIEVVESAETRYHACDLSVSEMVVRATAPTKQRTASRMTTRTRSGFIDFSMVDMRATGLRAPCITLVSTPVLITRPSTYSVLRSVQPRSSILLMLIAIGSVPSTWRAPVNFCVVALGCSHSAYPWMRIQLAVCSLSVPPN
mmetsp:Transcript_38163/g.105332  ORF Transcript_38163/g.105332 Transcript_38163/m.105332 type:complete len:218 (+) Transcript_38163:70-723(+)